MTPEEKLRGERLKRNMSQKQVADLYGVSIATISNWENGTHKMSKAAIAMLDIVFPPS